MDLANLPAPPERLIFEALPDDRDRQHRICLLRIHHAAERVQWHLYSIDEALVHYLVEPEPLYASRLLKGASGDLAQRLEALAGELRKSAAELQAFAAETYNRRHPAEPNAQTS